MDATFLVKLSVSDPSSIAGIAEEIHDLLADELPVIEVKPWTRPSLGVESVPSQIGEEAPGPINLPTL